MRKKHGNRKVHFQQIIYSREETSVQQLSDTIKGNYSNASFLIQKPVKAPLIDSSHHDLFKFNLKSRVKRTGNAEVFVEATVKGDFTHWLSQEDIADIARLEYNNYLGAAESNAEFEILGSVSHLVKKIDEFQSKTKKIAVARLTLIINLANLHWVTLVVFYKNGNYVSYYVDSKGNSIPSDYRQLLLERQIQALNLNPDFPQQRDGYNCGLWALENAANLNRMLNENQPLYWCNDQLEQPRNKEYFDRRRQLLAAKLSTDPAWRQRHPRFSQNFGLSEGSRASPGIFSSHSDSIQERFTRFKASAKNAKVMISLEVFTETFMSAFTKRLGVYHLLAKGEKLTNEALKIELKTGMTGALLGVGIAESLIGSIPSLVNSLRILSGKYYLSKAKAQKITSIFSKVAPGSLSSILSEAALDIFYSFESQFMQVTDKAGDRVAMEKLAEDAIERALNYIERYPDEGDLVLKSLIEEGVLRGPSEKFFDPSIKRARLRISGSSIQDSSGNTVNTANLYEKIGLVVLGTHGQVNRFYVSKKYRQNSQYGYRRLLDWEKKADGGLKESFEDQYTEVQLPQEENIFQINSRRYLYVLKTEDKKLKGRRFLAKMANRYPIQAYTKKDNKRPILFNLRKPVENFTGRIAVLEALHHALLSERTIAVVPAFSTLSVHSASRSLPSSSGSQLSISGLGGIGKTQLALRYAEIYAADYDYNVLWINAETKENLVYFFCKLATKLKLATRDRYNREKDPEEIIEDIYEHFSDGKSLFIFDNVENYRAIEIYLPKSMLGNKPTVLITSRYANWKNVASVLSLDIFTEQEAAEFINKSLGLKDNTQGEEIKELNKLLQGLPLALHQALAYINLRKNTDALFSLRNYIELYKEKNKALLSFNFSNYSNDPYLKTVFTTWLVTLDKIKAHWLGKDAEKMLNIMAYLDPENISIRNFFYLKDEINGFINRENLSIIMNLLSNYSMIGLGNSGGDYKIHRLVQQVIRIGLEGDPKKLVEVVKQAKTLFIYFDFRNEEDRFHYLHFLLYLSEHTNEGSKLKNVLSFTHISNVNELIFSSIISGRVRRWSYFIDLAYLKFQKQYFLKFLGDAVNYYIKSVSFFFLSETMDYIEKKWRDGILSEEDVNYIITSDFNLGENAVFSAETLSRVPEKRQRQKDMRELIYNFKIKIIRDAFWLHDICRSTAHKLKRSICLLSDADQTRVEELRNQKIKSHFKKVEQLSGYVGSSLMTKDILVALFQGDFAEVAVNFGLITSSVLSGKLSNSLLTQGQRLAADTSLLEKDLGLEGKNALDILFNEKVLLQGKRQFLGKTMQVVSPFVARGMSVFFAYNLKNEITAYRMGNKAVLPDIISNGIIVGIDGIAASIETAEFFELIVSVSGFTGPIGEGVAVLTWLGAEGYTAVKQVEAIEKYVHLSRKEEFIQFLRAFFDIAPSRYLQIKVKNEQLLEGAIRFLKKNTEIKRYIFPSFSSEIALYKNSMVFLGVKRDFILDSGNRPDEPSEGHLFCLLGNFKNTSTLVNEERGVTFPSNDQMTNDSSSSYLCQHALGIAYPLNRTGDTTLINLGEGDDKVVAALDSFLLFFVQNGNKLYKGNDKGSVFVLEGDAITGVLEGGKGSDMLILDKFYPKESDYLLIDASGFLCGKSGAFSVLCSSEADGVRLVDINRIYGRKNEQDVVCLNQAIYFFDGYGGRDEEYPDYFFIERVFSRNLQLVLRNNSFIYFDRLVNSAISVDYLLPADELGETRIRYCVETGIQHRFFFESSCQNIDEILMRNNTIRISIVVPTPVYPDKKTFTITMSDSSFPFLESAFSHETENATDELINISFLFKDIELKLLSHDHLHAQEVSASNKTVDEKIGLFRELSNRLDKRFSVQLINNATISIGRGEHEVFYVTGLFESHLVGNGGENVYVVFSGNETVFPLARITLYDTSKADLNDLVELTDTLDLREVVKKFKQVCPDVIISSNLFSIENDLILTLMSSVDPNDATCTELARFFKVATVRLKDALLDNWYQKLDIFFEDSIPRNIVAIDDESWILKAMPLIFTDDKKIIIITNQDIGEEAEIIFLKNIGNYSFFRNGEDLLLTNIHNRYVDDYTLICHQFYQIPEMKKKILSSTFSFFDQEIHPRDHQAEIDRAAYFSDITFGAINATVASALLNLTNTVSAPLDSKKLSQHVLSYSESASYPLKSNGIFDKEDDVILAMTDDYLEKYDTVHAKSKRHVKSYLDKKGTDKKKGKKKAASLTPVQAQKDGSTVKKAQQFYSKNNRNSVKQTASNYSVQTKTLLRSPTEKLLKIPYLSKPEARNQQKGFFKDPHCNGERINFFPAIRPLYHKEDFRPVEKVQPRLAYQQQSDSRSKKSNSSHRLFRVTEQPNLHETLMLLRLATYKPSGKPRAPVVLGKKTEKMINRAEKQIDRINTKVFKWPANLRVGRD